MQVHPVANIFPPMSEAEYATLKSDIEENGQLEPIWTWRGQILDGRHRDQACRELGLRTKTQEWDGEEDALVNLVISMNLHRRHLNESQRGMIATKLATLKHGHRPHADKSACDLTQVEAAKLLNVGRATVANARIVRERGSEEQITAVERGESHVTPIAKKLREPQKAGNNERHRGIRKDKSAPYKPETKGQVQRAEAQKNKMVSSLSIVTGHCRGLEELDVQMALSVCSKEEIKVWIGKAREASRAFRKFAGKLEKGLKHGN